MTTFIRFEFPPPMSKPYSPPKKRQHQSVEMAPELPTIQFRCDSCLQQHLFCSAHKPCHQCMDEGLQCTIDGGKPVKTSTHLKNSRRKLTIDTTRTTSLNPTHSARRQSGRPKSLASSPATINSTASSPPTSFPSAAAAFAPLAAALLANIVAEPAGLATQHSPVQSQSQPQSKLQLKPKAKPKPKQTPAQQLPPQQHQQHQHSKPRSPPQSLPHLPTPPPLAVAHSHSTAQLPWTNAKTDPRWSDKNATIVRHALTLLDRLRIHHSHHPGSQAGIAEMKALLDGPMYSLRAKAISSSSHSPEDSTSSTDLAATGPTTTTTTKKQKTKKTPSSADGNARIAAAATARLAAWIDESKVIDEAVWVLRDLRKVGEGVLEGGVKVPEWMLCE